MQNVADNHAERTSDNPPPSETRNAPKGVTPAKLLSITGSVLATARAPITLDDVCGVLDAECGDTLLVRLLDEIHAGLAILSCVEIGHPHGIDDLIIAMRRKAKVALRLADEARFEGCPIPGDPMPAKAVRQ